LASESCRMQGDSSREYGKMALTKAFFRQGALALLLTTGAAQAAPYEFLAAPETDLNRVYRLDKATGEIGACQYGAGPQPPGDYGLVASRHEKEGGVFRVDQLTGAMSICYVLNEAVVCTPPAK